jgi:hypothetical protein
LQEQIRAVGKIFIAFGIFGLVVSIGLLIGFGGFGGLLAFDPDAKRNDLSTIPLQRLGLMVYVVFSLVMSLPLILVGRGILRWQLWAHTGGILTGAAATLLFPFGTCVGIYALWVMLLPETEPLFMNPPVPNKNGQAR